MSALSEIIQALPSAVSAQFTADLNNRLSPADASRDAVRDLVRKLKGDISADPLPPEADEQAAKAALIEGVNAVVQLAETYETAVQLKVEGMQAHRTKLTGELKRLEAAAVPVVKPKPTPVKEPSAKTKRAMQVFSDAIDDFIAMPKIDLKQWDPSKGPHKGELEFAVVGAPDYGVGRAVALKCLGAQVLDKLYGFPKANDLLEYCFDMVAKGLQTFTYTIKGVVHRFRTWQQVSGKKNDKEWSLADHFPAICLEQFSKNPNRPGNGDRIALCLEILDGSAGYWNAVGYRSDLFGAIDRIIHPGITFQRRHRVLGKYHPDTTQREISKKLADDHAHNIAGEMAYIDTPAGEAIVHGCVIVGMGDPRLVGEEKVQYFQPNCYVGHDNELLFALGVEGEEVFKDARFQAAYSRTIDLLNYGAPFDWHSKTRDNPKGTDTSYGSKGTSTLFNQIAPPAYGERKEARWLDARKAKPAPITVKTITGGTRHLESADFGEHWRELKTMDYFGGGFSMAMGDQDYVDRMEDVFLGQDFSKVGTNPARLAASSYLVGLAAREGAQERFK